MKLEKLGILCFIRKFRSDPRGQSDATTQQLDSPDPEPEAQRSAQRGEEGRERKVRYVGLCH